MKKLFAIALVLSLGYTTTAQTTVTASPQQLLQAKRGYGMFIHFGINTFNETEWSDGTLPVSSYHPDQLDCDQWIKTAKEAGFRYVILVTKHHDGFCLWDSRYTTYDVASSPVTTDVVAAVAKACKKYGIALGLYYSLWDRHEPTHNNTDPQAYVTYMKNQLTELLTHYGNICEVWFDGGWAKKPSDWDIPAVYAHIKRLQPNCMVTVNHTIGQPNNILEIQPPAAMHTGDPIRFFPTDFRTKDPDLARWDDPKLFAHDGQLHYQILEHTLCLSDYWNWFQKKAMIPTRSIDELEELFYWCTAHNNMMVLNVPPDQHGVIRAHERLAVLSLADRLGIRNGLKPLPVGYVNQSFLQPITANSSIADTNHAASKANDYSLETWWTAGDTTAQLDMSLPAGSQFNRVVLFERSQDKHLPDGFSTVHEYAIQRFALEVYVKDEWKTIYMGEGIGVCRVITLPEYVRASRIRLHVLQASGLPLICHFAVEDSRVRGMRKVE